MFLTPAARRALEFGASEVLFNVHRMLVRREPGAQEPRHVCVMAQEGSFGLYVAWRDILAEAGIRLRVTGVYCHQTPKAHFSLKGGAVAAELGDLLIVHDHLHPTMPRRQALLVQAKMASGGRPIGPRNRTQDHLYRHWPDFSLRGHGRKGTGARFLTGLRRLRPNIRGCTYALIEDAVVPIGINRHLLPAVWRFAKSNGQGQARHAALTLADMVLGRTGAGRPATIPTGSLADPLKPGHLARNIPRHFHWSATVQELIDVTAHKALSSRMAGPVLPDRGVSFHFLQWGPPLPGGETGALFTGGRDRIPTDPFDEDDDEGIAIILIETSDIASDDRAFG